MAGLTSALLIYRGAARLACPTSLFVFPKVRPGIVCVFNSRHLMHKPQRLFLLLLFLRLPGAKATAGCVSRRLVGIYSRTTCQSQLSVVDLDPTSPPTAKQPIRDASQQQLCLQVAGTNQLCTFVASSDAEGERMFHSFTFFVGVLSPGLHFKPYCSALLGLLAAQLMNTSTATKTN